MSIKTNYSFLVWLHYHFRCRGRILKLLDEMTKSQWLTEDAIYSYQLDQLRNLFAYARGNVEYYRELFSETGLEDERDIKQLEDIRKIPVLTKTQIRRDLERLTAKRDDLIENQTGGSTGIPLRFYCNRSFINRDKPTANNLAYCSAGYRIGDGMATIWGYDNDLPTLSPLRKLFRKQIYNFCELNSFQLTEEKIADFIAVLSRDKISFVKGYASSLAEVSRYILEKSIVFSHKVKAVFSEAEKLDKEKRQLIEQAFQTSVYDIYGSREFGVIATECTGHNGLHINYEQLFVEIGEENKVLITSFLNRGTVFIRYEIGDCADEIINQKCSCGRSSTRLGKIIGRVSDNFVTSDGRIVHGEYVTHLFYKTKYVEQFQIIQNSLNMFDLHVVSSQPELCEKELAQVIAEMNHHFNARLKINLHFGNSIEKTRSGKQIFTICNARQPHTSVKKQ